MCGKSNKASSNFKLGDRVKVLHTDYDNAHPSVGEVGEVIEVMGHGVSLAATDESGYKYPGGLFFLDKEVEAAKQKAKFIAGDRVEYINTNGYATVPTGSVGTVARANALGPYVLFDGLDSEYNEDGSFGIVDENLKAHETPIVPLQAPIEVGSKVRVLASCGAFDAQKPVEGVVVEKRFMEDGGPMFLVEHTVKVWVTEGGLEAIKQDDPTDHHAWAPKVDLSLRVGARVEIVDDGGNTGSKIGMKGVIIELEEGTAAPARYGHFARLSMDDGQAFGLYEIRFKVIG